MTLTAFLFGALVGFSLGLTGGGGAIFAVPLLVFGLGLAPRMAVGVSLATVGTTSFVGFLQRWRMHLVEIPTGLMFAIAGMAGAPLGSWLSGQLPSVVLMTLFAGLMVVIALRMWQKASVAAQPLNMACAADEPGPTCQRDPEGKLRLTSRCALLLAAVGFGSGVLSGLFGVGGGFIIVPALVTFSGMGMQRAIGTSLLVIALISAAGLVSHQLAGAEAPWQTVAVFTAGSLAGLFAGAALAARLAGPALQKTFAGAILLVATYVIVRNLA